jgi:hypothetical protein
VRYDRNRDAGFKLEAERKRKQLLEDKANPGKAFRVKAAVDNTKAIKAAKASSKGMSIQEAPSSSGGGGVGMGQAVTALNSLKSADEGSSEVGNTSGGAGAADGAMKGAAAGAPMAAATGGASVAIGAVVGGTIGILKAKSNRKKKKALATAEHQKNLAAIEGQKGERIQTAMNQMRQSFSNALSIRSSVNLGG